MENLEETYYLVRADILPEAIQKTIKVKQLLDSGEVSTVQEAVERVGLSRSSFYKYKEGVHAFNAMMKEKIVTISVTLEHRTGVLSEMLGYLAEQGGNILTIHQTIPLQGMANIAMSVDTVNLTRDLMAVISGLRKLDGVKRATLIGRGE